MKSELFNEIAALLSGKLSAPERKEILEALGVESETSEVLLLADHPGLREELGVRLPFEVPDTYVFGTFREYFRALDPQAVRWGKRSGRLSKAIGRISSGRLPLCFKGRVDFEADLESAGGATRFALRQVEGSCQLMVEPECESGDHLEVWKNGAILRAIPVASLFERPIPGIEPGSHIALRFRAASKGLAIVVVPVEFGTNDWRSACLVNALMGNIGESIRILTAELGTVVGPTHLLEAVCRRVMALGALTKSESFTLAPTPAFRSLPNRMEDRLAVLRLVWEGIVRCWPEARRRPNPWENLAAESTEETPRFSEEIEELLSATLTGGPGAVAAENRALRMSDPQVRAGWAALQGWDSMIHQNFQQAVTAFESVSPDPEDPFGLAAAATLARKLEACVQESDSESRAALSDEVWKEVFAGAL